MKAKELPEQAVLCYVSGCWAFFTTRRLEDQWGDDWDDAPYEHNAGEPYAPNELDRKAGLDWQIVRVAWDGPFETPDAWELNSRYSVKDINQCQVGWLVPSRYGAEHMVVIYAGVTLAEFVGKVQKVGGAVYWPLAA